MPIPSQPAPSPTYRRALDFLAAGEPSRAEEAVRQAALAAKAQSGSGSHPLAQAYADMARLHYQLGDYKKAAAEFRHACDSPLPPDTPSRRDRLAFMFGFGATLLALGKADEAEKVFRQCVAFAKNLHGTGSTGYAASLEPLASLLLNLGKATEAIQLMDEAYESLWKHGGRLIANAIPIRAEALKAVGRTDNAFSGFDHLPDDLIAETVTNVIARSGSGDSAHVRSVLADLLKALDRKYGDGHPTTSKTLAAIVHHEASLGGTADRQVWARAIRRAVWSFVSRQTVAGLLDNLEVGQESDGSIHLVPHLTREPNPNEVTQLESTLAQALDDLYSRQVKAATR